MNDESVGWGGGKVFAGKSWRENAVVDSCSKPDGGQVRPQSNCIQRARSAAQQHRYHNIVPLHHNQRPATSDPLPPLRQTPPLLLHNYYLTMSASLVRLIGTMPVPLFGSARYVFHLPQHTKTEFYFGALSISRGRSTPHSIQTLTSFSFICCLHVIIIIIIQIIEPLHYGPMPKCEHCPASPDG